MANEPTIDKAALEAMLPCPFCGGTASVVKNSFPPPTRRFPGYFHPTCNADHGDCPGIIDEQDEQGGTACDFKTETEAIAAWNRRAPTTDGVSVKPLEWASEPPYSVARVLPLRLLYSTEAIWDDGAFQYVELSGATASGRFATVAEAKAAAQADYTARIMASLNISEVEPVATVKRLIKNVPRIIEDHVCGGTDTRPIVDVDGLVGALTEHLAVLASPTTSPLAPEGVRDDVLEEAAKVFEATKEHTKVSYSFYGNFSDTPDYYKTQVPVWRDGEQIAAAIRALKGNRT